MIRYFYLRDEKNFPIGCIAMDLDFGTISYGLSVLNPVDKFNRRLAKTIATGRMKFNEKPTMHFGGKVSMHMVTKSVMESISRDATSPARARKAARNWLRRMPEQKPAQ